MNEFDLIYQTFLAEQSGFQKAHQFAMIDRSIGDDCAVVTPPYGQKLVTCTDTLVQGRHFADDWNSVEKLAFEIGYKAVAVNVSDLVAMGAKPHSILLAIALPARLANSAWLNQFAKGLFFACNQADMALIGGDTTKNDKLVITITAQGFASQCVYRHTANVGDDIYVSGTVGDAGFALHHLDSPLVHRLHMPTPRIRLGQALAGKASAMIDISDGLFQDLTHIAKQSQVGFCLNLENLPCSDVLAKVPLAQRLLYQLTGGDDYELLFTLPKDTPLLVTDTAVCKIGEITQQIDYRLMFYHQVVSLENPYPFLTFPNLTGYQHFG